MEANTKSNYAYSLPKKQVITVMVGTMLALFLSSLDQTVVGTAMPRIITDLGGFSQYTWVTTIYIITSAIATPVTGKLTDMFGRKIFFIIGVSLFTLASLACGFSQNMLQIIIFRGLQGIGSGMISINAFTIIADIFPPTQLVKYQGYMSSVFGLSSVLGPTLGGFLTDALSWHWVFFINVPLGVLILILFICFFPDIQPDKRKHRIDYWGVTLLVLTVVPLMLALTYGGSMYPWGSAYIIGLFAFAATMLILLIQVERHAAEPILPKELFTNAIIINVNIIQFIGSMGQFSVITFLPLFFQGVLGASATMSGNYMIPMSLGMLAGAMLAGQVLSLIKGHYRILGAAGNALACVGILLLSRIDVNTSYLYIVVWSTIAAFGLGSGFPIYTVALQNAVPRKMLGVATSSGPFFRSIGGAVGLAIMGSILNNRFAMEFISQVPADIQAVVSPEKLSEISQNPQALVNSGALPQLQALIGQAGSQAEAMVQEVLHALRLALSSSISLVFLIAVAFGLIATGFACFTKEIPLRDHNNLPQPENDSHKSK